MTISAADLGTIKDRELDLGLDVDSLSEQVPLAEQGVDSLGMMDLLLLVKENYGVRVPDADLFRMTSLEAIAAYLNKL